jgi:hypothetical protein
MVVAAAAAAFWPDGLPDPRRADRDELIRWMVTRDLSTEPVALRTALAERIEREFSEGIDWHEADERLGDRHRRRLLANIPLLIDPWLRAKADCFARSAPEEQLAMLDRTVATLRRWQRAEVLVDASPPSDGSGDMYNRVMAELDHSLEHASPDERARVERFLAHLKARWVWLNVVGQLRS